MMHIARLILVLVGTAAYLGLAVLGWGGLTAFLSNPPLVALAIVTFALAGVSPAGATTQLIVGHSGRGGWRRDPASGTTFSSWMTSLAYSSAVDAFGAGQLRILLYGTRSSV